MAELNKHTPADRGDLQPEEDVKTDLKDWEGKTATAKLETCVKLLMLRCHRVNSLSRDSECSDKERWGRCLLCYKHCDTLVLSHVLPKFLLEYFTVNDEVGSKDILGIMRGGKFVESVDKIKGPIMCRLCEKKFSQQGEAPYGEIINEIHKSVGWVTKIGGVQNTQPRMRKPHCQFYFAASVLWRCLAVSWKEISQPVAMKFELAMEQLRQYLLNHDTTPTEQLQFNIYWMTHKSKFIENSAPTQKEFYHWLCHLASPDNILESFSKHTEEFGFGYSQLNGRINKPMWYFYPDDKWNAFIVQFTNFRFILVPCGIDLLYAPFQLNQLDPKNVVEFEDTATAQLNPVLRSLYSDNSLYYAHCSKFCRNPLFPELISHTVGILSYLTQIGTSVILDELIEEQIPMRTAALTSKKSKPRPDTMKIWAECAKKKFVGNAASTKSSFISLFEGQSILTACGFVDTYFEWRCMTLEMEKYLAHVVQSSGPNCMLKIIRDDWYFGFNISANHMFRISGRNSRAEDYGTKTYVVDRNNNIRCGVAIGKSTLLCAGVVFGMDPDEQKLGTSVPLEFDTHNNVLHSGWFVNFKDNFEEFMSIFSGNDGSKKHCEKAEVVAPPSSLQQPNMAATDQEKVSSSAQAERPRKN